MSDRDSNAPSITYGECEYEYGYFYSLASTVDSAFSSPPPDANGESGVRRGDNETIVSPEDPFLVDFTSCEDEQGEEVVSGKRCSLDPTHNQYSFDKFNSISVPSGGGESPFIVSTGYDCILLHEPIARKIKNFPLTGYQLHKVANVEYPSFEDEIPYEKKHGSVYQLLSKNGPSPFLKENLVPEDKNCCPFCGFAPILCPECGHCDAKCRNCKKKWWVRTLDERKMPGMENAVYRPTLPLVVDAKQWNGDDFFGQGDAQVVSRRAVEFFLQVHAYPFLARPLAINSLDVDDQIRTRLDVIQKRVS